MLFSQNPVLKLSFPRRIFIFFLGLTDSFLFGGAVFGWPQLVFLLKTEGVFSHLCNSKLNLQNITNLTAAQEIESTFLDLEARERCGLVSNFSLSSGSDTESEYSFCAEQDQKFALIYTIATLFYGIPGILVGFMLHYIGLRITRMLGGFMVSGSFICLSLATSVTPNWLFPSMALLSFGGNQLRMSGMQMGDLFPKYRSTTITVLSGVYAASASLFLVFSLFQSQGVSRAYICYFFAALAFVSALFSFVMPFHHIPFKSCKDLEGKTTQSHTARREALPLTKSLFTLSSYLHLYWFFISLFIINIYQQNYNVWVTASSCTLEEMDTYSKWFSYANLISIFSAPIGGFFTDNIIKRAKRKAKDPEDFATKEIQAHYIPLLTSTIFSIVMYGCVFFFKPTAIIISLVCMIVVRPCCIALSTAYLRNRFPGAHFNRLLGIYSTFATVLLFLVYPHFYWAQYAYYIVHGVTLVLLVACLSNPIHLLSYDYLKRSIQVTHIDSETENLQT